MHPTPTSTRGGARPSKHPRIGGSRPAGMLGSFARYGARALGSALGGISNILSPEVIVVGGGLAAMDEIWWAPLRAAFAAELIPATAGIKLAKAELGQDAALIGAASLWNAEQRETR